MGRQSFKQAIYLCEMQDLKDSLKYRNWERSLKANGLEIRALEELHTVRKRNGDVLFSMIKIDAVDSIGEPLLPIALLRGHFVGVLVSLFDKERGEEKFLMVSQRRVASGAYMLEHPAGMIDSTTDPFETGIAEVREETGIEITRDQLIVLNKKILYSSPGLIDEGGYFFAVRLEMSKAEIQKLDNNSLGHGTEGEFIRTKVLTREEAMQESTVANALLHFYLWEDYKRTAGINNTLV